MFNLSNSLTLVLMLASTLAVQAAPSPGYGYGGEAPVDNVVYYTKTQNDVVYKTVTQNSYETPAPQNNGGWSWKKTWRHKHGYGYNHGYQKSKPAPTPKKKAPEYQAPAYTPKPPAYTPTEPKPTPKPAAPKPKPVESNPSPSTGGSSLEKGMIAGHNTLRAQYGASPLKWSSSLAASAQVHASKCVFEHSGDSAGENIAGGSDIPGVCKMWGQDEASSFGGHFTQMVWKATKEVGCARVDCTGRGVVGDYFTVCQYLPAGNMQGAYDQNVQGYQ